jgi:hypothetical protein
MTVKERNPAPVSAGKNVKEMTKLYIVAGGNKHFFGSARQLRNASLMGVA